MNSFQTQEFFRFYAAASTKYQLHSPFVYELACAVLEDKRWFYAFDEAALLRQKMLSSDVRLRVTDWGSKSPGENLPLEKTRSLRSVVRKAGSSARQGRMLFRLVNHLKPRTMLELGTSVGMGAVHMASAAREATFLTLEGSSELAQVARVNLDFLKLGQNAEVREGTFEKTLPSALRDLKSLDFVFFDGNHRQAPTLRYFEECLAFAHGKTAFVFDDAHGSPEMASAWASVQKHPRVTLTIDFFELSLAFIDPDFREVQHFKIVPASWKPWRFF